MKKNYFFTPMLLDDGWGIPGQDIGPGQTVKQSQDHGGKEGNSNQSNSRQTDSAGQDYIKIQDNQILQ